MLSFIIVFGKNKSVRLRAARIYNIFFILSFSQNSCVNLEILMTLLEEAKGCC